MKDILDEAKVLVSQNRRDAYGSPAQNHGATADLFSAYLKRRYGSHMTAPTIDEAGDFIWQACTLAVMDNRYDAIENPSSRDINDARWRCVVKAVATLTGLGLQLYRDGSGVPKPIEVKTVKPLTAAEKKKRAAAAKKQEKEREAHLEDSLAKLASLVTACEGEGNIDTKGIDVAKKYLADRGPIARVEDAIRFLEGELRG